MPKAATYTLRWSPTSDHYELFVQNNKDHSLLQGETEAWFTWLDSHTSFSFQGKYGSLHLQKERRSHGKDGYWYGYRRQGRRMVKTYVGKSKDLLMARLETAAQRLETDGRQKAAMHFAFEGLSQKPLQEGEKDQAKGNFSPDHLYHPSSQQRERKEHVSDEDSSQGGQGKKDILLTPKLCPPRLPSSLVVRERLLARLDASQDHMLTLITAPAGFGKTTLVSHWVNERGSQRGFPPVAWISLDAGDNDPLRFWRYVLTACQAFQADLGRSSLALLATDEPALFPQPPFKRALTLFLNEVIHQQCHGILILEDYHVIAATEIHETMTFLLEHVPSTLHVVMMTRVEPPLPLTGLRARDELLEVHAVDLRFSLQETQRFLNKHCQCKSRLQWSGTLKPIWKVGLPGYVC